MLPENTQSVDAIAESQALADSGKNSMASNHQQLDMSSATPMLSVEQDGTTALAADYVPPVAALLNNILAGKANASVDIT